MNTPVSDRPFAARLLMAGALGALAATAVAACRDKSRESQEREHPSVVSERDGHSTSDPDRSGTTSLTSAAWMTSDAAVDRIVATRCARELTCSKVGPDKHFPTTDSCVVEVRKRTRSELDTSSCTNGIDGEALDRCLQSIRTESCENPLDTISRMMACRAADICAKEVTPHR